jgi:hypothetical protein
MADEGQAQFKAVITAEDETAGALASVERALEKLGFTTAQVEKELAHLQEVDEQDGLAQHFRSAETELRRMGLTAEAVKKEMDRLHAVQAAIGEEAHDTRFINPNDRWAMLSAGVDPAIAAQIPTRSDGTLSMAEYAAAQRYNAATAEHEEGGEAETPRAAEGEGGGHRGGGEGGHEHGFIGVREHFGEFGASVGEAGASLGEMLPMLGAFAAFGSAEGLIDLVRDTVQEQAALAAMSKQLGTTVDQLEAFHYAAKITDVPIDTMDRSLARLGVTMEQAASGKNKLAAEMFHRMGITLEDAHHHMLPLAAILPQVAQAIKNTADPQMRLYLATTLFGRAGKDLLPLLLQGRDGMRDLTDQADKLGPALTDVDRNHLQQFNDSWKQAEYVSQSFMTKLSADLAPVMTPLLDDFTQWLAVNKDWISLDVAHGVQELGAGLSAVPWGTYGHEAFEIASSVNALVDDTIGWKAVLLGLVGFKLASPFIGMARDVAHLVLGTKELVYWVGTSLPVAWNAATAAQEAYDAAFRTSETGRLLLIGLDAYDLTTKAPKVHLNPAQQALEEGWHLRAGQQLTPAEIRQLDALAPGQRAVEASLPQLPIIQRFERMLGLDDDGSDPSSGTSTSPGVPRRRQVAPGLYEPLPGWDPASLPPAPSWGSPSSAQPVGQTGTITHHVVFENVPPNVSITTTTTGDVGGYRADVGYSLLGGGPN